MRTWKVVATLAGLVLIGAGQAQGGRIGFELYRLGNTTTARMDNVRPGDDAIVFKKDGKDWVKGKEKGISTWKAPKARSGKDKEWKLPNGAEYPESLVPVNDHDEHVSWQPAHDMPLQDYKKALQVLDSRFRKTF